MKSKKGFTLIELLAVVLIIGILLLIAVPAVTRYILRGTNQYYHSLEDSILEAGRDYVNDYPTLFPKEIGNVTIIELNELAQNNLINDVVDKDGNTCDAKVTIKKTGKRQYEYYSCLLCENYQTSEEYCNYSEDDNVTGDTKNYRLEVDKDKYIVGQGEDFTVPTARAYYLGQLVNNNVIGTPRIIDTNVLGITTVNYSYQGAKKQITVEVVDQVSPSIPKVVLKYDNASGSNYNGGWYRGNIYAEYESTDYTKPGLLGSGVSYYEISTDGTNWSKISGNSQIHTTDGIFTYYVRSVDKAGNISEANSYSIKIDKETPKCNIVVTSGTLGQNNWYTTDVTLSLEVNGTSSGIVSRYLSDETINYNTTGKQVIGSITSTAGIISNCSLTVKVDKSKPQAPTITANDNIPSGGVHDNDTILTASGSTSTSDVTYYLDTNNDPSTKQSSVTITENTEETIYYAKACNAAGTCSDVSSYVLKVNKSNSKKSVLAKNALSAFRYISFTRIVFQNKLDPILTPEGINIGGRDISEKKDKSVMAYDYNGTLYIQGDGKIYANSDSSKLFYSLNFVTIEGLEYLDTSEVTNMSYMFAECGYLESLDLNSFNTSQVTDMSHMFDMGLSKASLKSLNISEWDTSHVTNMSYMFYYCNNLTSLDLNKWNTSQVTNMQFMFCMNIDKDSSLVSLNISNWNTSSVTDMLNMFYHCNSLTSLDLNKWNTSQVTDMGGIFMDCSNLTELNISSWDTSQVKRMMSVFNGCTNLLHLNLSGWDFSEVTNTSYMFQNCYRLSTTINITSMSITNHSKMFEFAAMESSGAKITINYTNETSNLVNSMIATKVSLASNVVKGNLIG